MHLSSESVPYLRYLLSPYSLSHPLYEPSSYLLSYLLPGLPPDLLSDLLSPLPSYLLYLLCQSALSREIPEFCLMSPASLDVSTIWSINPCSSRNSERWKPFGSFCPIVCSITRGPAKPISAFGSASIISPSIAKLAVTPPVVGSVKTLIYKKSRIAVTLQCCGCLRHLHQGHDPFLHSGASGTCKYNNRQVPAFVARSTALVIFSPTISPILAIINRPSQTASTAGSSKNRCFSCHNGFPKSGLFLQFFNFFFIAFIITADSLSARSISHSSKEFLHLRSFLSCGMHAHGNTLRHFGQI